MMTRVRWTLGLAVCLMASGCAAGLGTAATSSWHDMSALQAPSQAEYPDADAVFLSTEQTWRQHLGWTKADWAMNTEHTAVAILNESGRRFCDVKVRYHKEAELLWFEARSIAPDGAVTLLTPDNVYEDDEAADGDYRVKVHVLPRVQVGSVVEYQYALKREGIFTTFEYDVELGAPAKHVRYQAIIHPWGRWRAKAYNTDIPFKVGKDGEFTTITWEAKDTKPWRRVYSSPPMKNLQPRVVFVLTQFVWKKVFSWNVKWDDSVRWYFNTLERDRDYAEGFRLPPALEALKSKPVAQRIADAYGFVRQIPYLGLHWLSPRPLNRVLRANDADDWEKVALLREILERVGVESHFALVRDADVGALDPDFPRRSAFTEALLYLPAQDGVPEAQWLQPWCSHCEAPGVVMTEYVGQPGLLLLRDGNLLKPKAETRFQTVTTVEAEPPDRQEQLLTFKVKADGGVSGEYALKWYGREAGDTRRRQAKKSEKDFRNGLTRPLRRAVPRSKLTGFKYSVVATPGAPVEASGKIRAPNYAVVAGDLLLVPVRVLDLGWREVFEDPKRTAPIAWLHGAQTTRTLRVVPPEGYEADVLPVGCGEVQEDFGTLRCRFWREGRDVMAQVTLERRAGQWPLSEMARFQRFFRTLQEFQDTLIPLVRVR